MMPIIHHAYLGVSLVCNETLARPEFDDECLDTPAEAEARWARQTNDAINRTVDGTLYSYDPLVVTCVPCLVAEIRRLNHDMKEVQGLLEYHSKQANAFYVQGYTPFIPKPTFCEKCSSINVDICTGYRQFATITLRCSCQCHNVLAFTLANED